MYFELKLLKLVLKNKQKNKKCLDLYLSTTLMRAILNFGFGEGDKIKKLTVYNIILDNGLDRLGELDRENSLDSLWPWDQSIEVSLKSEQHGLGRIAARG